MSLHLVTGGAGFIGSHVADALADRRIPVRILDDLSTGRRENLRPDLDLQVGSITDPAALARALEGVDVVIHLAACISVPGSVEEPLATHEVNVEGTAGLLKAAAAAGVRRVVFASSTSVYGDAKPPVREDAPPRPLSPYAVSKLAGEHLVRTVPGIDGVSLRFFNVYGPRQVPGSSYAGVIPAFLAALDAGRPLAIHGDGEQTRDFVHVSDVVAAVLAAAEAGGVTGRSLNVGTGRPVSVVQLAHAVARAAGARAELEFGPGRRGDIRDSWADVSAAERALGFRARRPLDEGLGETARWHRGRG